MYTFGRAKTFFPQREEMERRLIAVNNDADAITHFYPALLADAGQIKNGAGIVTMLELALLGDNSASEGFPADLPDKMRPYLGSFILALVDDSRVSAEAIDGLQFIEGAL